MRADVDVAALRWRLARSAEELSRHEKAVRLSLPEGGWSAAAALAQAVSDLLGVASGLVEEVERLRAELVRREARVVPPPPPRNLPERLAARRAELDVLRGGVAPEEVGLVALVERMAAPGEGAPG